MKKYVIHNDPHPGGNEIDFKGNLNKEQYEVVEGADGPCLVLAGAGSGKTRTLIYRLAYLIKNGVHPANILLVTFTNKAAREMRTRAENILGYKPAHLWSGTFHHIGNRILRIYADVLGFDNGFIILDQNDSRDMIKSCINKKEIKEEFDKFPKASIIQTVISYASNTNKTIEKVLTEKYPYFYKYHDKLGDIKKKYETKKADSNCMDYDDLLLKWRWLLENHEPARERFTDQFKYIMVDEYQDTNTIQADIIDILASGSNNILVVGDDAQSIYSFRGARVENILSFPEKYQDVKTFKLEVNYRSTPEILDLANDSIINNLNQFHKDLRAVNEPSEKPAYVKVRDNYYQSGFVVQRIRELLDDGLTMADIAVLFRAHYQSAELEMEMVKQGIPYIIRGGVRFFEQRHIKDVMAFLKIYVNPNDEISWQRTLTLFPGIGAGYAVKIYNLFRGMNIGLKDFLSKDVSGRIPKKAYEGYKSFRKIMTRVIDEAMNGNAGNMIKSVLDNGYETKLFSIFDNAQDRLDDIHELESFSDRYDDLDGFISDLALHEGFKTESMDAEDEKEEHIVLSTIHQAKGLEWESVFVIGLAEGQFPHFKSLDNSAEEEEERRLFYVAVTRAKKYLYLLHPSLRYDHQKGLIISEMSRFVEELPEDDYEVWETDSGYGSDHRYRGGNEDRIIDI